MSGSRDGRPIDDNPYASPSCPTVDADAGAAERSPLICGLAGSLVGAGSGSAAAVVVWLGAAVQAGLWRIAEPDAHELTVVIGGGLVTAAIMGTMVGWFTGAACGVVLALVARAAWSKRVDKTGLSIAVFCVGLCVAFVATSELLGFDAWVAWLAGPVAALAGAWAGRLFARRIYAAPARDRRSRLSDGDIDA